MAEGSNYDYLFKVDHHLSTREIGLLTALLQVVLIGDSGVGKSYVSSSSAFVF